MSLIVTFKKINAFLLDGPQTLLLLVLNRCMRRAYLGHDEASPLEFFAWTAYSRCVYVARSMLRSELTRKLETELRKYNARSPHVTRVAYLARAAVQNRVRVLTGSSRAALATSAVATPISTKHISSTPAVHRAEVASWLSWNHRFIQGKEVWDDVQIPPPPHTTQAPPCTAYLGLPSDVWFQVLDFLMPTPHDLVGIVDASREFRELGRDHPMHTVLLHAYLDAHCTRPLHVRMMTAYQTLATSISYSRAIAFDLRPEAHNVYARMVDALYMPCPVPEEVRLLDYELLTKYGMDALMFAHPMVTSHKAMLYDEDTRVREATARGSSILRNAGAQAGKTDVREREQTVDLALEALMEWMLYPVTDLLQTLAPLLECFDAESPGMMLMLKSRDVALAPASARTRRRSRENACPHAWFRDVVGHMERSLGAAILWCARQLPRRVGFCRMDGVSNWFCYMNRLYNSRAGEGAVKMRLAISPVELGECTSVSMRFEYIGRYRIPVLSLSRVWGEWPPNTLSTLSDADLVMCWWGGVCWLRERSTPNYEYAKYWLVSSDGGLRDVMVQHGKIIGKCAPCGRPLRRQETWIGSTCESHLP